MVLLSFLDMLWLFVVKPFPAGFMPFLALFFMRVATIPPSLVSLSTSILCGKQLHFTISYSFVHSSSHLVD